MIKVKKTNKRIEISTDEIMFFDCSAVIIVSKGDTVSLTNVITKTVNEANNDDTEEYLNINETISQVKINKMANWSDNANNIPK